MIRAVTFFLSFVRMNTYISKTIRAGAVKFGE